MMAEIPKDVKFLIFGKGVKWHAANIHIDDVVIAIDLYTLAAFCKEIKDILREFIDRVTGSGAQQTDDSLTFGYSALIGYIG